MAKRTLPSPEQYARIDAAFDAIVELLGITDPEDGQVTEEGGRCLCLRAAAAERLIELARLGWATERLLAVKERQ